MKSIRPFIFKRKFGKDLLNKDPIQNHQENKINWINNKTCFNSYLEKNNIYNVIKPKYNNIHIQKNIITNNNINITESKNNSPQYVDEYTPDIIKHIIENESLNILNYDKINLFELQNISDINEVKRKNIIELLVYYNNKWKLNPDSIYLAINIMDRYISKIKINKNEYELIGLASFMIASKYEDIYSPNANTLTYVYSFKYEPVEILEKEKEILYTLDFSLLYHSSFKFLNLFFLFSKIKNENVFFLSEFILELSLTDIKILKYSQRKRAFASFLLAKKIFNIKSETEKYSIQLLFSLCENEVKVLIKELSYILKKVVFSEEKNLIAEKYKSSKYGFIVSIFENKLKERVEKIKNDMIAKNLTEKKNNNKRDLK